MKTQTNLLVVQRYFYNFREGFFDYLSEKEERFVLINHIKSNGRVFVNKDVTSKKYIRKICSFVIGKNIVFFPFLFAELIRLNPCVIVTEGGQNTINNIQLYLYSILFNKPFIQWDLGRRYMTESHNFLRRYYMFIYKIIAKRAKYIFGYNSESEKYFLSLGIEQSKIVILNNTVDTILIKKIIDNYVPEKNTLLKNLISSRINIIFVGALLPSKNIESLAEILKNIGDNYHLMIIGSGTPEYEAYLKSVFEGTNHCFLGHKTPKELISYYQAASFLILPGLGGLTINQSMAFGVPVLCTIADGTEKDLIINDVNGYIYRDIKDVSDYILSKKPAEWKQMGENAQKFLFEEFSIDSSLQKFLNYVKLIKKTA
jgi:glycosyltransferase involved in cell wall biosynthesis